MSDTTPNPNDAATQTLRERVAELDADIQGHQRCIEIATACRQELQDVIALLSRKLRARTARTAKPNAPTGVMCDPSSAKDTLAVFATPFPIEEAA